MKSTKLLLACAAALSLGSMAQATEVGRWYGTGQIGALFTDDDRNLTSSDRLFGLSIGKHMNESWSLELNANGAKLGSLDPYAASLDALRVFRRDHKLQPFLTIGAGAIRNDFEIGSDTDDFMAQAGMGLLWRLGENRRGTGAFSLRPEIKARWDDAGREDYFDYIGQLGFQFSFGGQPKAQELPAPQPAAPLPPPPPPAPRDSDGDGVIDARDKCPGTPAGVAVDADGCPQRGEITLHGVGFGFDSDQLTPQSSRVLDNLAADLKKFPRLSIELQGHTDSVGADAYNQKLSQQRADAVREYLLTQGVNASQISARGYGESRPVANNATAEGRALNRRVVMQVLSNPGDVDVKGEERK